MMRGDVYYLYTLKCYFQKYLSSSVGSKLQLATVAVTIYPDGTPGSSQLQTNQFLDLSDHGYC